MKLALAKLGLIFAGLTFMLFLGEVALRVYQLGHGAKFFDVANGVEYPLGWGARRVWGDPQAPRPKLLVLGDSMTEGKNVPDGAMYYTVLGRLLNAEVFAVGGGGYGTLQESMALEQALTTMRPDLVVLQVTSNDFVNNVWALESRSYFNSNLRVRPYLNGDAIVYRFPSKSRLVEPMVNHSRLAYLLMAHLSRVGAHAAARGYLTSAEHRIKERELRFPAFRTSVDTTERIIATMKGRAPLVVFAADDPAPYLEAWRQICARQRVPFLDGVPVEITNEERRLGHSIRPDGAHWDIQGHRVVGEALARWLADLFPR